MGCASSCAACSTGSQKKPANGFSDNADGPDDSASGSDIVPIDRSTTLLDLATAVSEALRARGLTATLAGGAAVSLYSGGRYISDDLDFVTSSGKAEIGAALEGLGFVPADRGARLSQFTHPDTHWYVEFPPSPIAFGGRVVGPGKCATVSTPVGDLRIVTPTHCIMDRLAAASHWQEEQSVTQAILVAEGQRESVDWNDLDAFVLEERIEDDPRISRFYSEVGRPVPVRSQD